MDRDFNRSDCRRGVTYGGWRIIKTLGMKIAPLVTEQGFAAETSAAGVAWRFSSVRWGIAIDIVLFCIVTLPATIVLGWIFAKLFLFMTEG